MVGSGNHHRVDIGAGENFPEVRRGGAVLVGVVFVDNALGATHVAGINIADRQHLGICLIEETGEVDIETVPADTDHADGDALARGIGTKHTGGNDGGKADGCCGRYCCFDEGAA